MTNTIRRYYDQNTRLFLRIGSTPGARAIHRALWPAGIDLLDDALNVSNHYLLDEIQTIIRRDRLSAVTLADLGCGVAGSLLFLLGRLDVPTRALGVTISSVQARLGAQALQRSGWDRTCAVSQADFQALPAASCFDLAYAVEASVHASDLALFYSEAARIIRPSGRLVLVDDFLQEDIPALDPGARSWLDAYRTGWHTPGLVTLTQAETLAAAQGLRLLDARDLTPLLRLRLLPEWLAARLLAGGRRLSAVHPLLPSMTGSLALQHCLHRGLLRYRLLVFEKQS